MQIINNAERLAKSLKSDGFPASLIKKEGELTKVSVLSFTNKASAQYEKTKFSRKISWRLDIFSIEKKYSSLISINND